LFASGDLGNRVRGYVLECPYRDLRSAVNNRIRHYLPPPASWLAYAGLSLMAPLAIGDVDRISPRDAAQGIPKEVPVLLLAGSDDYKARSEEALDIAERIGPRAQVEIFARAGHLELYRTDPDRYRSLGLKFLASCRAAD
jgi:pimeloyl-ACP methyl ester carboxylesterase